MKILHVLIGLLTVTNFYAQAESILNLEKIGKSLGYPSDQLVIEDYLEIEKSIYIDKMASEISSNTLPPFTPERIYKAYKITGKNPSTFLPIIITVATRDTYRTDAVRKLEIQTKSAREVPAQEGGRLPFGDFKISETATGFFVMLEMRVPTRPSHFDDDPPGVMRYIGSSPQTLGSYISLLQVPESDVDVRIAQYMAIENYTQEFVQIPGGEKYFNRFGHLNEENSMDGESFKPDEPFHKMIINVFRSLNLEVLESPLLNPFRKEQKPSTPISVPDSKTIPQPIVAQPPESPPLEPPAEVIKPQPQETSWLWLVGLIALIAVLGFSLKRFLLKSSS